MTRLADQVFEKFGKHPEISAWMSREEYVELMKQSLREGKFHPGLVRPKSDYEKGIFLD